MHILNEKLSFQEEHEAILKRREDPNSGITWKEYKSMTFTFQVFFFFFFFFFSMSESFDVNFYEREHISFKICSS